MGLGGYLAARTDQEHYESERREFAEVDHLREREVAEVETIFQQYGLAGEPLRAVVGALTSDRKRWVEFMLRFELGLERPDPKRAPTAARVDPGQTTLPASGAKYCSRRTTMNARDVMTKDVVSVHPNTSIADAVRLMLEKRISGLPVLDSGGRLIGIITEGDFLRRAETNTERKRPRWLQLLVGAEKLAEEFIHAHGRKVSEVMTQSPVSVAEETPLDEIVHLMETRRIKRVPVVRNGKIVGIVSRANLLQGFASLTADSKTAQQDDRAIREQVIVALERLPWAANAFAKVLVKDGLVHLWGSYMAARQDEAMVVAAENVPGVRAVRSHLCWVDPVSGLTVYNPDEEKERKTEAP